MSRGAALLGKELIAIPLPQTRQETRKTRSPSPGPCPDAHMVEVGKRLQASTYRYDVSTALEQGARDLSRGTRR